MNGVLNSNTTLTAGDFLNYTEHSFSEAIIDWYDSLDEKGKNALRMMETPGAMFEKLCMKIEVEFYWC